MVQTNMERSQMTIKPNKSLKHVQRVALNWTPSTGAASHYRAGFSRRLALRYVSNEQAGF
jgi:hypothetical protein